MQSTRGEPVLPRNKRGGIESAIGEKVRLADSIISKLSLSRENRATAFRVVLEYLLRQGTLIQQPHIESQPAAKLKPGEALTDRISMLASEGFFKEPKAANQVQDELENRGAYHSFAAVGMALLALVRKKTLRRVPVEKGGKKQYLYTNP